MIRDFMRGTALASALIVLPFLCSSASAQLAVSANDNKIALVDGVNTVPANPAPDTVTVLDIGVSPPKVLGEVQAPSSVVGVPQSVAVAKDESFALVTAAMKVDPADPKKTTPDDKLSVIDLKANPPAVIATLQAGPGVSGVSINPAGTLAITADRSEGTLSVFTISGKTLTPPERSIWATRPPVHATSPSSPTASPRSSRATAITGFRSCRSTATKSRTPEIRGRRPQAL